MNPILSYLVWSSSFADSAETVTLVILRHTLSTYQLLIIHTEQTELLRVQRAQQTLRT